MPSIEEVKEDLAELKELSNTAKRTNVRSLLLNEINKLELQIKKLEDDSSSAQQKSVKTTPVSCSSSSVIPLNKITTYAYDQSEKFLKLYVTVPGVEKASPEQVTCKFLHKSIDLFVREVQGKNHQLVIQGFLYEIDPSSSSFKIKKDTILLNLKKAQSKTWECVTEQEQRGKDKKPLGSDKESPKEDDPNASLMKMMKQMYDEGDDDMKRTIKKAWCESQDKKTSGGMMPGMMDDFGGGI